MGIMLYTALASFENVVWICFFCFRLDRKFLRKSTSTRLKYEDSNQFLFQSLNYNMHIGKVFQTDFVGDDNFQPKLQIRIEMFLLQRNNFL